jgi:hypothetical protein
MGPPLRLLAVLAPTLALAAGVAAADRPRSTVCALPRDAAPRRASCLSAVRADVTGDGRSDRVLLYGIAARGGGDRSGGFGLELVAPGATPRRTRVPRSDGRPFLIRVGNVNGVPGAELVVELDEISSGSTFGLYTDLDGRLQRVGPLLSAGGDSVAREGFACRTGRAPALVQRIMDLRHGPVDGAWRWRVITYAWRGQTLARTHRGRFVRRGLPHGRAIAAGAGCGRRLGPPR